MLIPLCHRNIIILKIKNIIIIIIINTKDKYSLHLSAHLRRWQSDDHISAPRVLNLRMSMSNLDAVDAVVLTDPLWASGVENWMR